MWPKYMWVYMRDAFCCRLSLFRVFAKIKKTVSTSLGLAYSDIGRIIYKRLALQQNGIHAAYIPYIKCVF